MLKKSKTMCMILSLLLATLPLHAVSINSTAVAYCESTFFECAVSNASTNCTTSFDECILTGAFSPSTKSQECYLAESAWLNLKLSSGFAIGIFLFSTLVFPAFLKVAAKKITKWSQYDSESHPLLGRLGPALLYMTDSDGDGKVTASELITPQTIFSFSSVALPIFQWITANDAQAKCNYQDSLLTAS